MPKKTQTKQELQKRLDLANRIIASLAAYCDGYHLISTDYAMENNPEAYEELENLVDSYMTPEIERSYQGFPWKKDSPK